MKLKVGTFLMFIFLLPIYAFCELEGHAVMDESIHGIRMYQRPKVKIPAGWQEHVEAGQESQCLVLVPKKDSEEPKTMIFAMAIQKDKSGQSLASFLKEDIEHFKENNTKGIIKKVATFKTAKDPLSAYNFSYPFKGKQFMQTVVYTEEGEYFITFTLTGKTPTAHKAGEAALTSMLSTYK